MKILLVHTYYQQRGGEDQVFEDEAALLKERGHEIETLTASNFELDRAFKPALVLKTLWNWQYVKKIREHVRHFAPDVVHFHNLFPLLSPAVIGAARREGPATVVSLHNFRLLCINGLLYRQGRPCEDCISRVLPLAGIGYRCYRGDLAASAVVSSMQLCHRCLGTFRNKVDLFFALSHQAVQLFVRGGLPADRFWIKPNLVSPDPKPGGEAREGLLFVGRLSEEKGIRELVELWIRHPGLPQLTILGDGPLAPVVIEAAARSANLVYRGRVERSVVVESMKRARALVFSSRCYENFPMTVVEAFACGLPVIAPRRGAAQELVEDGVSGWLFEPDYGEDLVRVAGNALGDSDECLARGKKARQRFEHSYHPEIVCKTLLAGYKAAIRHRRQ